MAYTPQTWQDLPSTSSPIDAARLNYMETGIAGAYGAPMGLTGATSATRYVGATVSGAPVSGTFAVGDFVIDQSSGYVWICTAPGSPGTWTSSSSDLASEVNRAEAAEASIQAQVTAFGSPISPATPNAALVVNNGGTAWSETLISSANIGPTAGITDNQLQPVLPTASVLGWKAWNGDPAFAGTTTALTTGVTSWTRIYVPQTISPTKISIGVTGAGASLTTIASASVSGTQSAPSSGSWTLTTSSVGTSGSVYAASGIATIGSQVVAYSAWANTSMTVIAGGYTPSASYTNATTISANLNSIALYDSSGNYIAATIDQPGSSAWTSTGLKQGTLVPAPTISGGSNTFIYAGVQSTGGTPVTVRCFTTSDVVANAGPSGLLSGANRRSGTVAVAATTGMPSSFTAASLVATNSVGSFWAGLS